ncbi:hypothetical protein MLD38_030986 [Melastoma candidum]|uniref:Uncharacterized protein n=1 Tax=Melastoma candidum TaxID=119954 RepID=A0ACB9MNC8_9MYRT|nr:hypothetical protein MLD38_030986 [Melastoma candidum]
MSESPLDQKSNRVQFLNFESSPPPLQLNNYQFLAPQPRFLGDPLHTVQAAPIEGDGGHPPLAAKGVLSTRKKASKRKKPPPSKWSRTTFITADVANFRQMVQHVTGPKFSDSVVMNPSPLGPEPRRAPFSGSSSDAITTSHKNEIGSLMAGGFVRADTRMFEGEHQAAVGWLRQPAAVVDNGGAGDVATSFEGVGRFTRWSREENSNSDRL